MENERPAVGPSATTLGVRTASGPNDPAPDIVPDGKGDVTPATGGMSVSPSLSVLLSRLPARMIPRRLRQIAPKAAGNDNLSAWAMGDGAFVASEIADKLALRPDPEDNGHGFVEPDAEMSLQSYRAALEATRDQWQVDERNIP